MRHDEQVRVLKTLMSHLDNDTNVDAGCQRRNPTSVYTCLEMAEREWQTFFKTHPQIIGMSGDLPEKGSFRTLDDFGVPILATRDKRGAFRAFLNACSHRGSMVENRPRGQQSHFACPFHAWTYSSGGDLVSVPKQAHFGEIDKACMGLTELPAVEHRGFLIVHPNPEGEIDPVALFSGLDDEFESWNFGALSHVNDDVYDMRLNWKLTMDTFGETYHFSSLHKNTLAMTFYGNAQAYDTYGRNHRMALCLKEIDSLRGRPESEWDVTVGAFPVYYLFPNIQVNCGAGGIVLVRAYPVPGDPGRSISRISFYARPDRLEAEPEMVKMRFRVFADVVRDEDYATAVTAQRTAEAGLQDEILFGRNEPALHHYHNTYREALGLPLLEAL